MSTEARREMQETERDRVEGKRCRVAVCAAAGCLSNGGQAVRDALQKTVKEEASPARSRSSAPAAWACATRGPSSRCRRTARHASTRRSTRHRGPHRRGGRGRRHAREGSPPGRKRRVLRPADEDRPRELRPHRPRADRVVHRRGRLRGAAEGPHRDDPGRRDPADHGLGPARARRRRLPHRPQVEHGRQGQGHARSTSSATPTRAIPAPSWTAASWRATPTGCWRGWPSPPTPSGPTRATSTSAASTRWPSSG